MNGETINQRITRIRKSKKITQKEMAERLGMKESTYSQMERQGNISAQTLLSIAAVLEVDINLLLYGEEGLVPPEKAEPIVLEQRRFELKFEENDDTPKPVTKFDVAVETFRSFNREQQAQVYDLIQKLADEGK